MKASRQQFPFMLAEARAVFDAAVHYKNTHHMGAEELGALNERLLTQRLHCHSLAMNQSYHNKVDMVESTLKVCCLLPRSLTDPIINKHE